MEKSFEPLNDDDGIFYLTDTDDESDDESDNEESEEKLRQEEKEEEKFKLTFWLKFRQFIFGDFIIFFSKKAQNELSQALQEIQNSQKQQQQKFEEEPKKQNTQLGGEKELYEKVYNKDKNESEYLECLQNALNFYKNRSFLLRFLNPASVTTIEKEIRKINKKEIVQKIEEKESKYNKPIRKKSFVKKEKRKNSPKHSKHSRVPSRS